MPVYVPMPWQRRGGVVCACGQFDCLEVFCSGAGIAARFNTAVTAAAVVVGGDVISGVSAKEVCVWARDPDAPHHVVAAVVVESAAAALASACLSITRILDPSVIILTGPLAPVLCEPASEHYRTMQWRLHDDTSSVDLRLSTVVQPGVVGAACAVLSFQGRD